MYVSYDLKWCWLEALCQVFFRCLWVLFGKYSVKVVAVMCSHTFLIITSGCLCLSFFLHAAIPGCHDKVSGIFQDCQRGGGWGGPWRWLTLYIVIYYLAWNWDEWLILVCRKRGKICLQYITLMRNSACIKRLWGEPSKWCEVILFNEMNSRKIVGFQIASPGYLTPCV